MAGLQTEHVGDYAFDCPVCGVALAVPVMVEPVDADQPGQIALRASVNVDPIHDHAGTHGLSRPSR